MGDKPTFDFSKLNFDLGAGGFNFQSAIQSQLGALVGADSGYFKTLPKVVQRRVRALRNLDREYETIEEEFEKELKALELKYHKERYTPLFQKRADIVSGKVEPTDEEAKEESDDEEGEETEPKIQEIKEEGAEKKEEEKEETEEEKNIVGVPEFWLTALKHHEMIDAAISEKDEDALKHLVDITQEPLEEEQGSFTLKFHFKENPYFTNEVISKTYHLEGDEGDEVICESVDSTAINWKEGKDLTHGVKKGFGPEGSFFNFFAPPEVKQGKQASPKIVSLMELDFEMAVSIKEEIIKHAVHWFTGEASVDGFGEDDDEGIEFGGEGDEDEEDDEEDGDYAPPEGEGKPECKQQ